MEALIRLKWRGTTLLLFSIWLKSILNYQRMRKQWDIEPKQLKGNLKQMNMKSRIGVLTALI